MTSIPYDNQLPTERTSPSRTPRWIDRFARRALHSALARFSVGTLTICDADGARTFGGRSASALSATVEITDPRFYTACLLDGTRGAGEAYMNGWWLCDQLADLIRLFVLNRGAMRAMDSGWSRAALPAHRVLHWLERNTREGSLRNIKAHYDLGNEFFSLFLDPTLMYSGAVFERPGMTLAEAQFAKLERICRKLGLCPGQHVLEIGTGWGGFAIHAASRYGCRVTTTTISREQAREARRRVETLGLTDRVTILEQDYRDLRGQFDRLVSIEMIEAVGHQFLDSYFRSCASLLKPDGVMALQAITIGDRDYDHAIRNVDFIQKHVFPGSFIPSLGAIHSSLGRVTDLRVVHAEDFGAHYAVTLRHWRDAFMERLPQVRAMGFDGTFCRMWEFYLAYCEGAFAERHIGVSQLVLAKPGARPAPILGTVP
ncbi:MAG: tuberculostearic acid methyltransferase UfaA1 [Phycisphaerae bacterium]